MKRMVALIILDGWGIGPENEANPIHVVAPPTYKYISENYPLTSLAASGIAVGLPWGEIGSSEVGHLTLGAGKVVYQYFPKIMMAIQDGTFFENPELKKAFAHAREHQSAVNLVGLLSRANTHASIDHLQALLQMAEKEGVPKVNLHLFTDGVDSPPRSVLEILGDVPREKVATLMGRYYAMDRSQNWTLTQRATECLLGLKGDPVQNLDDSLKNFFARTSSEEFLPPMVVNPQGVIKENDAVIFFNFREDSMRQLAEPFATLDFNKFQCALPANIYTLTLTHYHDRFIAPVAFMSDKVEKCLGTVLAENGKTQLRLAETYKYAHVTYFFNGYAETPMKSEYRALVPSLVTTHPEEHPELMAAAITDRLIEAIQNQGFDFVLVNYSNPDTIAHTGNYDACLAAVKIMDAELGRILKAVEDTDAIVIVTSDHGNIEEVLNQMTGMIQTQHDANPVPFHLIGREFKGKHFALETNLRSETAGILSDVAPTILELMNIPQPPEMTGRSLLANLI